MRRRPENITTDLLEAAAIEFAANGFEGASTRRIAARAGAHQPQINYHFSSKEDLWKATVARLFDMLQLQDPSGPGPEDLVAAFSDAVRRFITFSAEHPELNRIINLEATSPTSRLYWLVDTYMAPIYQVVVATWATLKASDCGAADLSGPEVWELITSYGALHFANGPMLARLGMVDDHSGSEPDLHADRVLRILFAGDTGGRSSGQSRTRTRVSRTGRPKGGRGA